MAINTLKTSPPTLLFLHTIFFISIIINTQGQHLSKALLLTGNGNVPVLKEGYPPWTHDFHNYKVARILEGIVAIDTTSDLSMLNTGKLAAYDLIISNSLFLTPTKDELQALFDFVSNGKSFLTLHCGILSFLNWKKYEEFMGGIFIGGPSSEPDTFKVYTTNDEFWGYKYAFRTSDEHPVSVVVDDFYTKDELYYFQPNTMNFHVIARAENHPVMWWHPVGKGKVMSLTLGHNEEAKNNPGYQELLKNGVRWLMNYPLVRTPKLLNISNRQLAYHDFLNCKIISNPGSKDSLHYSVKNPDALFSVKYAGNQRYDLKLTGTSGSASFEIAVQNQEKQLTRNEVRLNILNDGDGNMALYHGNTISGSPSENQSPLFHISNIIDGDLASRWSSKAGETANLMIDLQQSYEIGKINIHWEASYAAKYDVLVSTDAQNWKIPNITKTSQGLVDALQLTACNARYIKLNLHQRAPGKRGYSIYEIEIYK